MEESEHANSFVGHVSYVPVPRLIDFIQHEDSKAKSEASTPIGHLRDKADESRGIQVCLEISFARQQTGT